MNQLLNGLKNQSNFTYTENGALTHKTTKSMLLDMFAMGAAYRTRTEADVILLFKNAYQENPEYALKCLFYIRDVRGGQGERRFFRVCYNWLAKNDPEAARRNMIHVAEYGRWDDLYCLLGTSLEKDMFALLKKQFVLDLSCQTPSLLAKWLPSCNASSKETITRGNKTRMAFGLTQKEYRKALSALRKRINVLERLMSLNKWDEIQFDKIPSKAGLIYKNAFARRDIIKAKYEKFAKDENTKVNASVLNPVDIADQIFHSYRPSETERLMWDKYWNNLKDYYNGREEKGIAVVDVSGSMSGQPMNAAVSMGAYIAERGKGPFHNHFITFSNNPELVKFEGVDLYDKFMRARQADWGMSTNLEGVFELLLNTALRNKVPTEDMPEVIYIFSDMEWNACLSSGRASYDRYARDTLRDAGQVETLMEGIERKWANHGLTLPRVVFWNLDCRHENIPALGGRFSYVSGFSMSMVEQILSGEDGYSLMMKVLDGVRYENIY